MKIVEASTRCTALLDQVECLIAGSDIGVFKIPIVMTELRIASPDERKQYKISVNDDGSLSATEVVE